MKCECICSTDSLAIQQRAVQKGYLSEWGCHVPLGNKQNPWQRNRRGMFMYAVSSCVL